MANRTRTDEAVLVPAAEPASAAYERDFYTWSQDQARLVREGRWDAVDRENVAEEIDPGARAVQQAGRRAPRADAAHAEMGPPAGSPVAKLGLVDQAQRNDLADVLSDNPGLKPRMPQAIQRAYRNARTDAARETGLDEDNFPIECPYLFEDITSRVFPVAWMSGANREPVVPLARTGFAFR